MGPSPHEDLSVPKGMDPGYVYKDDPTNQVPLMNERWKEGNSYGEFELKTFQMYYENHK